MGATGKKTNRKMRRTIRRTVGALLMVSAITVAAIPVPEMEAFDPDAAAVPVYVPATSADYVTVTDPTTSYTYNGIAYHMRTDNSGNNELVKQFEYRAKEAGGEGFITKYYDTYPESSVELNYRVYSDYVFLRESEYQKYYNGDTATVNVTLNLGETDTAAYDVIPLRYKYTLTGDPSTLDEVTVKFFKDYFLSDYNGYLTAYADYMTYKDDPVESIKHPMPTAISRTYYDALNDAARNKFICDQIFGGGTAMHLEVVSLAEYDSAGTKISNESVYSPRCEDPSLAAKSTTIGSTIYHIDEKLFLARKFNTILGISSGAFHGSQKVHELLIDDSINTICDGAFEDSFLEKITLSDGAQIGNRAFANCQYLAEVNLPDKVSLIGAEAFIGDPIKTITIPSSITKVGYGAFANCSQLRDIAFTGGNSVNKTVEDYAFYNCIALNSVEFNDAQVTKLGNQCFAVKDTETGNLNYFKFPDYVSAGSIGTDKTQGIGKYVLGDRKNLKNIVMPVNIGLSASTKLEDTYVYGCTNLESVEFPVGNDGTTGGAQYVEIDPTTFYSVTNPNFYVRGPKLDQNGNVAKTRESVWEATMNTINKDQVPYVYHENNQDYYEISDGKYVMTVDSNGVLSNCEFRAGKEGDIDPFTIPASVGTRSITGLGDNCISDKVKSRIISLVIEDGSQLTEIGNGAFVGCDAMKSVDIGNSITSIGESAFEDCKMLDTVTIGENIASIGAKAFKNCTKLENINFDSPADLSIFTLDKIGEEALSTGSEKLTVLGEIGTNYAPFAWSMQPNNWVKESDSVRVCYKTPQPTSFTVILDNQNNYPTLIDYPHYENLDELCDAYYLTQFPYTTDSEVEAVRAAERAKHNNLIQRYENGEPITSEEENMVKAALNIVVPEGIKSIDVAGYLNNSSLNPDQIETHSNAKNIAAYNFSSDLSYYIQYAHTPVSESDPNYGGLFAGYYGTGSAPYEDDDGHAREFPNGNSAELKSEGNDRITSVTMYDVVYLPDNCFNSCENLETVSLGDDIIDCGIMPFHGCTSLTSVACSNGKFGAENGIFYRNLDDGKKEIVEGFASRGDRVGDPTLSLENDPILADVTDIADCAFKDCEKIDEVDLDGVTFTKIPEKCFEGCVKLADITLPENIDEIGDECFAGIAEKARVTAYNKNLVIGTNSKKGVTDVKFISYEDAPARTYAKKQGYDVSKTLDNAWTITYICNECIKDGTGASKVAKEVIEDGEKAHGVDEDDRSEHIAKYHPEMEFDKYSDSLKDIHESKTIYMILKSKSSPYTTPGVTPGTTTPGVTPGNITPVVSPKVSVSPAPQATKYNLQVVYGSGSGQYPADTVVIIEAIDAPQGKVFDKWVVTGASATLYSATSKATTVKTAGGDSVITATYKDATAANTAKGTGNGTTTSSGTTNRNGQGTSSGTSANNGNNGTRVDITKPGISNTDKAYASVSGSTDSFVVKITESADAANQVATALANKYADMTPIKYFAMDISLYDATGANKITDTTNLSVNVTMPIPDALTQYAGNNKVGAVINGSQLEDLPCKFTTIEGIPCVSFTANHFSPYTIYVDTNNLTAGTIDGSPKTGDIHPKWFVALALAALSMILFLKRDKVIIPKTA